jgi:transcriptional regulator with XRE-family HTH domain
METIPDKLVKMREGAGLSQKEIARVVGLTIGAICNYEKGRRQIRARDFEIIQKHCLQKIKDLST